MAESLSHSSDVYITLRFKCVPWLKFIWASYSHLFFQTHLSGPFASSLFMLSSPNMLPYQDDHPILLTYIKKKGSFISQSFTFPIFHIYIPSFSLLSKHSSQPSITSLTNFSRSDEHGKPGNTNFQIFPISYFPYFHFAPFLPISQCCWNDMAEWWSRS